ncbi:MAG: ATP-binding protein, partial [Propionibacteriaceae bacterium]|nr:ATP-binding protein [Propionibacteriaceae bacterium]
MSDARPFQVDLAGVVDLLSRHIYSSPRVYIRELLQNGVDAITARREYAEENGLPIEDWGITIEPGADADGEFRLTDEGMGLTATEVSELLATVGRSSKKDILGMQRTDYLGQFGIGLLSCFMVCDEIHIVSRSATGANAVEWVGSSNGTFSVTELPESDHRIGTTVTLRPRFDTVELLTQPTVQQLATDYGEYLPVPIDVIR